MSINAKATMTGALRTQIRTGVYLPSESSEAVDSNARRLIVRANTLGWMRLVLGMYKVIYRCMVLRESLTVMRSGQRTVLLENVWEILILLALAVLLHKGSHQSQPLIYNGLGWVLAIREN
jgi:hypothetical protein